MTSCRGCRGIVCGVVIEQWYPGCFSGTAKGLRGQREVDVTCSTNCFVELMYHFLLIFVFCGSAFIMTNISLKGDPDSKYYTIGDRHVQLFNTFGNHC